MSWFDAGVNLLDSRFDPGAVIHQAAEAGVTRLCLITTHPHEWDAAVNLYTQFPQHLVFTIGVHPHNAKDMTEPDYVRLAELAVSPGCVAIGECGLDFNRNFSPQQTQLEVFRRQLAIAVTLNKPVYLHERDAFEQQLSCMKDVAFSLKGGIAHCFTGTAEQMQAYLDLGLYIGVTGWVCDPKRGESLREAVTQLPLERLILETDAPYLYPKTRRPRERNNHPAFLPFIGEELAALLEISPALLQQTSYANTCKLFAITP